MLRLISDEDVHEDLVRGLERHLRLDRDAELRHAGPQAFGAEGIEGLFALPGIDIVAVRAFPPGEMREAARRCAFEPTHLCSDLVVLLHRDSTQNDVHNYGHFDSSFGAA